MLLEKAGEINLSFFFSLSLRKIQKIKKSCQNGKFKPPSLKIIMIIAYVDGPGKETALTLKFFLDVQHI